MGHLFKSQIWIFQNFSSFLVLSGAGNKRRKIPPLPCPKKVQGLGGHASLKRFLLQTPSWIFLMSLETLLPFHGYESMSFIKNWLSADSTEPLHWHNDFFSTSIYLWGCFTCFVWSAHPQHFRITPGLAADPPNPKQSGRKLLSSLFSAFLHSSSKECAIVVGF